MPMVYAVSFNVADATAGYGTITFSTAGKSDVVITVALMGSLNDYGETQNWLNPVLRSSWLAPDFRGTGMLRSQGVHSFPSSLQTGLRAGATNASWTSPTSITVTLNVDVTPPRYEIAYPTAFTAITFSTAAGRTLLGFTSNFVGSATLVTSSVLPQWLLLPSQQGASLVSTDFEPKAIGGTACASNGTQYGVHRYTSEIHRDWVQQYETKAKTYREFAAGAMSFQALYELHRAVRPFAVCNGFGQTYHEAFYLREPYFRALRASPGNDAQFHIPFKTVLAGRSS